MVGLSKTSKLKEIIVKKDTNTAIRYKVVEEKIDLKALREEKENIEKVLVADPPSQEELLSWAKDNHEYYTTSKTYDEERLKGINKILGV